MKIDDFGRKIADLKNENQKKVQDLKEDQNEIVARKEERLKNKIDSLKNNQAKEVNTIQDNFDNTNEKMAKANRERFSNYNKALIDEKAELKDQFLKENKEQRKEFQEKMGDISSSYNKDLGEQRKQSGIKLHHKDEVSGLNARDTEFRHSNEMNDLKDSTNASVRSQQARFAKDQDENRIKHTERLEQNDAESSRLLNTTKNDLNDELLKYRETQKAREQRSDDTNTFYKNNMGMTQNRKLEQLVESRDRQVSDLEDKFNDDKKQILEGTRSNYNQTLDEMERSYYNRSFKNEDVYREGIQLRDIEKDNMKVKFDEKQKAAQRVFTDEVTKLSQYQAQKLDNERENMRREAHKRDTDYKQRLTEMRVQFNQDLSKQRDTSKEQLSAVSNRYEERVRSITAEAARESERKTILQRQEIENIVSNNNLEKKDMIAYYEDRLKNSAPQAKASNSSKNSQKTNPSVA